jgi:hypothetical protein
MYKKYSNEIVAQKPQAKQAQKREPIPSQVSPRRIDLEQQLSLVETAPKTEFPLIGGES